MDGRPADLVMTSPLPCDFKVGEHVIFTNDYGVQFDLVVRGFADKPDFYGDDPEPRFIYVFTDAWWVPVAASSLQKREFAEGVAEW